MNYATSTSTSPASSLTTAQLLERIRAVKAALDENPEPVGEWMRGQGFPPETCCLLLPESHRAQLGPFWPPYVAFSKFVASPTLVRFNPRLLLPNVPPAL